MLIFNNYSFSQSNLIYSHSIDLTESDIRTIIHIDGISDSKQIATLVYDRNTLKDSIIIISKQTGEIQGRYAIENRPNDFLSAILTDSFACFLDWGNEILAFRRTQNKFTYNNTIKIKDKYFAGSELYLEKDSQIIYLKDDYLKVIEINIQSARKDRTFSNYLTFYNKTDSLKFLAIYQPQWLMDRSESGTLGLMDFEGNLVFIKNNKTYKTKLFESEFTTAIKNKVLLLEKSYKRNPTYEILEETDDIVIKHKRSIGILLSDSFFILTYQSFDSSSLNKGIPVKIVSEVYRYHLEEETLTIAAIKLYEHIDNMSKWNLKESCSNIDSYIDLSSINIKSQKFLCGDYLYIYCDDILDFLNNNTQENQTLFNFLHSTKEQNQNKKSKLLVFKIN